VLYTVRSERLLIEQLDDNLLLRWFVGLKVDDPVWDPTTFTKNRERLLARDVAQAFFEQVLAQARQHQLWSDEHVTVDGTLMEAWAGQKSFKSNGTPAVPDLPDDPGNPSINFRWLKTVGLLRKTRHRGMARVGWMFTVAAAVYNLVRMRRLVAVA
jgi:hypothetical protein